VEKANRVLTEFPDILSKSFDVAEFKKDYQLAKDLKPIAARLKIRFLRLKVMLSSLRSISTAP